MTDDIKALADRLLMIEARLYALEDDREPEPEPEPVPEWRWAVDLEADYERAAKRSADDALARVLWLLYRLAEGHDTSRQLTHIVAVCEAQVGGGWQADPDGWAMTPNLTTLLLYLSDEDGYGGPRWQMLGDAAAAWLRDLTEEQS